MSGIADMFGGDQSYAEVENLLQRNEGAYKNLQTPDYAEYVPDLYNTDSANYQLTQEDPALKSAQLSSLAKLADLSNTGESAEDAAGFENARALGQQEAKAGTDAALANAQARGVGGSGMEFALREQANQSGAGRSQQAALEQAANSARQRALYNQAYADQAGQVRGQDLAANQANTNIVNQFNQANTAQRNQTAAANTDARNQAFQYNQGNQTQAFNNQLAKLNGQTQATTARAGAAAAAGAAQQDAGNRGLGAATTIGSALLTYGAKQDDDKKKN